MAPAQEKFALDWIKADLLETLNEARVALDDYAENGGEETRLRACLTSLHQVHGTLVMLELYGITLLADHLERLAQAMLSDALVGNGADQALMQGILELPGYLDELQRGAADSRSAFIPLVNEIRELLGEEAIPDQAGGSLVDGANEEVANRFHAIDGASKVMRMRSAYQNVLLLILKGEARSAAVETLKKIAIGLQKLTEGSALERQWQAFAEFIDSLAKQEGALESEAVKLLRRVDLELKSLVKDGVDALRRPVNMELVQQLLDAAAEREHETEVTESLREALNRDSKNNTLAITGRQALSTAAVALRDELLVIKDKLDLMSRAQSINLEELRLLVTPLKQIGSTLSLLGFESSREILGDQVAAIEDLVVLGDTDPDGVQSVAAALVQIDENLSSIVRGSEQTEVEQITSDAQLQVLSESRKGIDLVKVAVVDFVTAEWDVRHLGEVEATLGEISGALEIVPLPRVISVLNACAQYVSNRLLQGHHPDWQELDQFAEIISGVDYYLERLGEQSPAGAGEILQVAERALADLDLGEVATEVVEQVSEEIQQDLAVPVFAGSEDAKLPPQDAPQDAAAVLDDADTATSTDAVAETESLTEDYTSDDSFDLSTEAFADVAGTIDNVSLDTTSSESLSVSSDEELEVTPEAISTEIDAVVDSEQEAAATLDSSADVTSADVTDIVEEINDEMSEIDESIEPPDPEIVEIFVEEIDEVLENVDEWLPRWAQTLEQGEAISEIRRAFHTLKGSGRIVQAVEIGELAWGVENMLNRVMDDTVQPTAQFVDVINQARALVPELRVSFEKGVRGDLDAVSHILEQSDILASGGVIDTAVSASEVAADAIESASVDEPVTVEAGPELTTDAIEQQDAATIGLSSESQNEKENETENAFQLENLELDELGLESDDQVTATDSEDIGDEEFVLEFDTDEGEESKLPVSAAPTTDSNTSDWADTPEDEAAGLAMFVGEAEEHLDVIVAESENQPWQLSEPMTWAFHTLAGSAAMADVDSVRELVDPTYAVVKAFRGREASQQLQDFINTACRHLRDCLSAVTHRQSYSVPDDFVAQALLLSGGQTQPSAADELLQAPETAALFDIESLLRERISRRSVADSPEADATLSHTLTTFAELAAGLEFYDTATLADALGSALGRIHTAGGFEAVGVAEATDSLLMQAYDELLEQLNQLAVGNLVVARDETVGKIRALDFTLEEALEEAAEEVVDEVFEEATEAEDAQTGSDVEASAAQDPELDELDCLEAELVGALDAVTDHSSVENDDFMLTEAELEDALVEDAGQIETAAEAVRVGTAQAQTVQEDAPHQDVEQTIAEEVEIEPALEAPSAAEPTDTTAAMESEDTIDAQTETAGVLDEVDVDDDLVLVFFEEADEINEELEVNLMSWSQEMDNRIYMENLLRGLHTLKGGARLCGLMRIGDMAHEFESALIEVQNHERVIDEALFVDLHGQFDQLVEGLAAIRIQATTESSSPTAVAGETATLDSDAQEFAQELDAVVEELEEATGQLPEVNTDQPDAGSDVALSARRLELEAAQPQESGVPDQAQTENAPERGQQEMVRVGSALLEELVNLAGENSILRARVEQGMSDFTGALDEMETTIEHLREQLRRLEIETETQVLFRHEREDNVDYANFDPLEMDRYSQLQQLSRGLSESASDMLDLKDTLLYKARESETLLLQQARINTELQEGLMRTRMVPFSRLLPRLQRIVRQVSGELNKDVEFHVQNAEGELDRNLLERMVPPLEHMLRNALDHGIETEELRRNFGKPGKGRIDLRLTREGGDVVIEISDDGAGIDVESVRAKAIERHLTTADANLSDEEVMQFILAAGFSTAKSVTQISGRGVGMDVVHSEVKQLGGSINIMSRAGQGTRFVLRVPFTVSVNRALMVSVADDLYAIPLNTIEGIVLLSPEQIQDLYTGPGNTFEYAGVPYRARYLGQYLGREYRGAVTGQTSVPVVLVRVGDHAVAIHVDAVQGSREIVVKSLGPQFAGVGGISGATILGDGSVVVILDLLALIRAQQHQQRTRAEIASPAAGSPRCVLVVDDSVTVRKVTSRLLERQGMDVLVAKDGIEAVAMLQERRPDIMLLDIEMPRMDGFEVARQVRHDDRLESLPIVMISSRTGDKHKEHANQLGVNRFLGKPFQENELLATIDELVTRN